VGLWKNNTHFFILGVDNVICLYILRIYLITNKGIHTMEQDNTLDIMLNLTYIIAGIFILSPLLLLFIH